MPFLAAEKESELVLTACNSRNKHLETTEQKSIHAIYSTDANSRHKKKRASTYEEKLYLNNSGRLLEFQDNR